jgi:hypothetical protein
MYGGVGGADGQPSPLSRLTLFDARRWRRRTDDLRNWAGLFRQFVARNIKVYAYANQSLRRVWAGNLKLFWDEWKKK